MRGLEGCRAAMELLAFLLAEGASQEFVFADMTSMAWESEGNYKCLCWSMSWELQGSHPSSCQGAALVA